MAAHQVQQLTRNCEEFGIPLHGLGSANQGIVHVPSGPSWVSPSRA